MLTKDEAAAVTLKFLIGDTSQIPTKDLTDLLEFLKAMGGDNLDDCR